MTKEELLNSYIELMGKLIDKIEPAVNSALTAEQKQQLDETLRTLPETLREMNEKLTTLESKEDKVGLTSEQVSQLIETAIAQLPDDQIENAEQVKSIVQPLLEALPKVTPYDDSEVKAAIKALQEKEDKVGATPEQVAEAIRMAVTQLGNVATDEEVQQAITAALSNHPDKVGIEQAEAQQLVANAIAQLGNVATDEEVAAAIQQAISTIPSGGAVVDVRRELLSHIRTAHGGGDYELLKSIDDLVSLKLLGDKQNGTYAMVESIVDKAVNDFVDQASLAAQNAVKEKLAEVGLTENGLAAEQVMSTITSVLSSNDTAVNEAFANVVVSLLSDMGNSAYGEVQLIARNEADARLGEVYSGLNQVSSALKDFADSLSGLASFGNPEDALRKMADLGNDLKNKLP